MHRSDREYKFHDAHSARDSIVSEKESGSRSSGSRGVLRRNCYPLLCRTDDLRESDVVDVTQHGR